MNFLRDFEVNKIELTSSDLGLINSDLPLYETSKLIFGVLKLRPYMKKKMKRSLSQLLVNRQQLADSLPTDS